MRLTLVTPPAAEPLGLAETKAHLRVDGSHEDDVLAGMIATARAALDGRAGLLGRALVTQTWRMTLDAFPREIAVPLPPLRSVVAISYLASDGTEQVLVPEAYAVDGIGDDEPAKIRPARGTSWPTSLREPGAVTVEFVAGYGEASDVPGPLRAAMLMHVAHLYDHRELAAADALEAVPMGYAEHIAPYRLWGL